jgi:hypothetical protein
MASSIPLPFAQLLKRISWQMSVGVCDPSVGHIAQRQQQLNSRIRTNARAQDPSHQYMNSINEGVTDAGYKPCMELFTVIANAAYGPYQKSAFFLQLQDAATEMAVNTGPNDALLLRFWGDICADHSWTADEDTNVDARIAFIQNLPANKVTNSAPIAFIEKAATRHPRNFDRGNADA